MRSGDRIYSVADLNHLRVMLYTSLTGKWLSPMHPEIVKDEPGKWDICGMPLVRAESLVVAAWEEQIAGEARTVSQVLAQ